MKRTSIYSFENFQKKITWKYFLFSMVFFSLAVSQDAQFSQYASSPLSLNPAMTGRINNTFRFSSNYRTQNQNITSNNYRTTFASLDVPLFQQTIGVGFIVLNSTAGDADLKTFNALVSVSYTFSIGRKHHHHVSLGVQSGIISKSFDPSKLIFNSQYHNGEFDVTLPSGESFNKTATQFEDVNAGLLWYLDKQTLRSVVPFAGVSVFHFTEPNQSFFGGKSFLSRKFSLVAGMNYPLSETFTVSPHILWLKQNAAQQIHPAILLQYGDGKNYFLAGTSFRLGDAVVAYSGIQSKNITFGFSYDITVSPLKNAGTGISGFELSFSYFGDVLEEQVPTIIPCFRF